MTVRLLKPYAQRPVGAIATFDASTEAGMIEAKQASADLTGGFEYFLPRPGLKLQVPQIAVGSLTLRPAEQAPAVLPEGQVLNVSGIAGTVGKVHRLDPTGGNTPLQSWVVGAGVLAPIGPYVGEQRFLATCSTGSVDVAVGSSSVSLPMDWNHVSILKKATIPVAPFAQFPDGSYMCTSKVFGNSATYLFKFTGDILTGVGTSLRMGQWSITVATDTSPAFVTADGSAVVSGPNSGMNYAKLLASGAVLIWVTDADLRNYIYRAAPMTYALGNALGANRRAVLHLGSTTGVSNGQTPSIRLLHARSICEASVYSAVGVPPVKKILIAEYNVASGRVPGAVNDQVICWQSLDDGLTFVPLLTFNTDGTHLPTHFHAVIQDARTGLIYFLLGDVATESAVIAWDGKSAAPAANSTYAQIAATPGWSVITGNELCRYGDLVFGMNGVYGLPDADAEAFETHTTAFQSIAFDRKLQYMVQGRPFKRVDQICPLIGMTLRDGGYIMGSLRTQSVGTANEPYLHFWSSWDGMEWDFPAKFKNYKLSTTANVLDIWQDAAGNVIVPAMYNRGINWLPSVESASALILTCARASSTPTLQTFD